MQSRRRLLRAGLINLLTLALASTLSAGPVHAATPSDAVYTATPTSGLGAVTTVDVTGSQLGNGIGAIAISQCPTGAPEPQWNWCGSMTTLVPDAATGSFHQTHEVRNVMVLAGSGAPIDCRSSSCELVVFNLAADVPTKVAGFPLSFVPPPRFHPLPPARIVDTRTDPGAWAGKRGPGASRVLEVAGAAGVPGTSVSAAVLNVTVTNATAPTHLVVWPADDQLPDTSALNAGAGETVASLVTTGLDATGRIQIANNAGAVDVIVDVYGWFDEGGSGGDGYEPVGPARLFDSREGSNPSRVIAGQPRAVPVAGVAGIPADATAVAVTVTGVYPSRHTHITAWPAGSPAPSASTLNLEAGDVHANAAVLPIGANGSVMLATNSGETDVVLDVMGWFGSTGSLGYTAVPPQRRYDTRSNPGLRLEPGHTTTVGTVGWSVFPLPKAVLVNTTLITSDHDTHLTVYNAHDDDAPLHLNPPPPVSTVNARADRVASAEAFVFQSNQPALAIHNNEGHPDALIDFVGYFS